MKPRVAVCTLAAFGRPTLVGPPPRQLNPTEKLVGGENVLSLLELMDFNALRILDYKSDDLPGHQLNGTHELLIFPILLQPRRLLPLTPGRFRSVLDGVESLARIGVMCSIPVPDETSASPSADLDLDEIQEQLELKNQRERVALKVMTDKQSEQNSAPEPVPFVSLVDKPIRLLKREQPRRPRLSESELNDEARRLEEMTLDERRANYDKIRDRIFNASTSEKKPEVEIERVEEKPQPPIAEVVIQNTVEEVEVSTPNEVMVETINHLTYVQMLSDQTAPNMTRPPPQPIQPPVRIQPGLPLQRIQPPPLAQTRYGAPPPLHGPPVSGGLDLTQPPPPHGLMHPNSMFPPMSYMQAQYGNMPFSSTNAPLMMQAPPLHTMPQPLRDCFPPLTSAFPPLAATLQFNGPKKRGQQNNRNVNQPRK